MLEYTILCIFAVILVYTLDKRFKTGVIASLRTDKIRRRNFILAIFLQLIFDNLTVWRGFWTFNEDEILGIYIPIIPLENLIFGICLFLQTAIFYTKFRMKTTNL